MPSGGLMQAEYVDGSFDLNHDALLCCSSIDNRKGNDSIPQSAAERQRIDENPQ